MPNFLDKLRNRFSKQVDTTPQTVVTGYEAYGLPFGDNSSTNNTKYLGELRGWVGACVTAIADEVASIDIKLYEQKNNEIVEVQDSPVLDLLYKVNSYTTRFDHFWITQVYLELTGEAPWFLEREGGIVKNIYFLRPDKITPIVDGDKLISGYKYDVGMGKTVKLELGDVIFLKYPNPEKPFRGKSPLEMAAVTVDIDNYSEEWNKTFYKNSAHPDSVLKVKVDQMSDQQKEMLKRSLRQNYESISNAHKTMVLFGDMEFEKLGFNQKEMDFLEQQKFSRDKILGIFRVPKSVIAQTEGTNFASAKVGQYTFARWTIKPKMERLVQQLSEFLLPQFKGTERQFFDYPNIVPDDEEVLIKKYESAIKSGWMTINEVRNEQGLPPIENGDIVYQPANLVPLGTGGLSEPTPKEYQDSIVKCTTLGKSKDYSERLKQMKARSKDYFQLEQQLVVAKSELIERVKKGISAKLKEEQVIREVWTEEKKLSYWKKNDDIENKYEPQMVDAMEDVFRAQRKVVMSNIGAVKTFKQDGNAIYNKLKLNEKTEVTRTMGITIPILEKLFEEAGNTAYEELGTDLSMNMDDAEIKKIINDNGRLFSKSATQTTNQAIKDAVYSMVKEGETLAQLKKNLAKLFSDAENFRAKMIARTETVRYNNAASEKAFVDSGVVEAKQWFINPTACELCIPMSGKILPLGKNFFNLGDTHTDSNGNKFDIGYTDVKAPPLHPNCKCNLVPVFRPLKSINSIHRKR